MNLAQHSISVITPVYNGQAFIEECISSVLAQGYASLEHIIVDDGSTDDTVAIVQRYPHVRLVQQDQQGAPAARNRGIACATGAYYKFLDADDVLPEGILNREVGRLETLGERCIGFGDATAFGDYGDGLAPLAERNRTEYLLVHLIMNNILTGASLYPAQAVQSVGGFDERLTSRQEWNLNIRIAAEGWRFVHSDILVYCQRFHNAPHRISNRKLLVDRELENLEYAIEPLLASQDREVLCATAAYVWGVGRQFILSGAPQEAEVFFTRAREISDDRFLRHFKRHYRIMVTLIGPTRTGILSKWLRRQ